ncbi:bifunctional DNA primase/polymerase [Mycobacteroides abscessus]|uniref:bifunctional DNA primase/polymerase n=1 Tax=Mycobacteroides abscessus TaxID=36809 RepID=UPI000C265977|nr:bifunctional DNA primase/polymerase [Mycobacteroides abscessus]
MVTQSADNGQTKKLTRRKAPSLVIPDTEVEFVTVARKLAERGWHPIALPEGHKFPPPTGVTGYSDRDGTDADFIAWQRERGPNANVGLRCHADVIGLDVDAYDGKRGLETLTEHSTRLGDLPDTWVTTARDDGSGIRWFRVPTGTKLIPELKADDGSTGHIEVIQRHHRYGVAPGSVHHTGAYYRLHGPDGAELRELMPRPEELPMLPKRWRDALTTKAGGAVKGHTDAEVERWLDSKTGNDYPHGLDQALKRFRNLVGTGNKKPHLAIVDVLTLAMKEVAAGGYPGRAAKTELLEAWHAAVAGQPQHNDREFYEGLRWAIGKAEIDDHRQRWQIMCREYGTDHRDTVGVFDNLTFQRSEPAVDDEAFWTSRAELTDLRQFARARRVAPWAVLGYVLARAVCAIPPHVVLPALVGAEASLNLFVALVGPSGAGKGGASGAAKSWLRTEPETVIAPLGSGEGMAKVYAYKQKPTSANPAWTQVGLESAVLFDAPEVDNLAALSARNSSTLLPQLRSAYSGEELGFSYADPAKSVRLCAYRYRLCLTVGVQPGRGSGLLDDADGGTPQRFVWLPTTDPDIPDEAPEAPAAYELPIWPTNAGASKITLGGTGALGLLDVPAKPGDLRTLTIPTVARTAIDEHRCKMLRGDAGTDPLDGHRLLCRLKVAAALMWLDRRTDEVSEQDWELAGTVMAVSDATRRSVVAALADKAQASNRARGRADTVRAVAAEEARADMDAERIERVAKNVVSILEDFDGEESRSNVRKKLVSRDRSIFEEHVEQELI